MSPLRCITSLVRQCPLCIGQAVHRSSEIVISTRWKSAFGRKRLQHTVYSLFVPSDLYPANDFAQMFLEGSRDEVQLQRQRRIDGAERPSSSAATRRRCTILASMSTNSHPAPARSLGGRHDDIREIRPESFRTWRSHEASNCSRKSSGIRVTRWAV